MTLEEKNQLGLQQPFSLFEKWLQKEKIKYLPSDTLGDVYLDIGCGDGSVFENTGKIVHGVDNDPVARELASKVREYEVVFPHHAWPIAHYQHVTMLGVLEHVDNPFDLIRTYSTARSIYITVPNGMSFHRQVGLQELMISSYTELQAHDLKIGHLRYFTPESFQSFIKVCCNKFEYKIVKWGSLGFKFTTNKEMEPYLPIINSITRVAENNDLVGPDCWSGAELFCHIIKDYK